MNTFSQFKLIVKKMHVTLPLMDQQPPLRLKNLIYIIFFLNLHIMNLSASANSETNPFFYIFFTCQV